MTSTSTQLIALLLLTLGCVTTELDQPPATRASFVSSGSLSHAMHGVSSYALHPNARIIRPRDGVDPNEIRRPLEAAFFDAFSKQGYQQTSAEHAERVIAYAIGISGELSDRELQTLFGFSPGIDSTSDSPRGGLVLVIVDPRTGRVLWRNSASIPVEFESVDQKTRRERIRWAVDELLSDLPPSVHTQG